MRSNIVIATVVALGLALVAFAVVGFPGRDQEIARNFYTYTSLTRIGQVITLRPSESYIAFDDLADPAEFVNTAFVSSSFIYRSPLNRHNLHFSVELSRLETGGSWQSNGFNYAVIDSFDWPWMGSVTRVYIIDTPVSSEFDLGRIHHIYSMEYGLLGWQIGALGESCGECFDVSGVYLSAQQYGFGAHPNASSD